MSLRRFGGRRTARNPEQADVHGKLLEKRFDLPAEAPPYRPSPHEAAEAAFEALPQAEQDQLTGWVVSNLAKATPRAPWDGGPKTGLLGTATLAQEAAQDLGQPVSAEALAGALLALGFRTVKSGNSPAGLQFGAEYKQS